jgi:hypothetical protein
MSTDRVACLSIVGAPIGSVVLVFGLENAFHRSVVELAYDWAPDAHPQDRNAVEESEERRVVRASCRVTMEQRGEN